MNKLIITIAAMFLSAAASAQSTSTTEKTGVNSVLGMAPSTQDFVTEAATSDMFDIESSKLAMERSDAATKAVAQQMITDHEKTTADLKGLAANGKVKADLPSAMTDKQQSKLNDLKALQGDDFNKQYHAVQVERTKTRPISSSDMETKANRRISSHGPRRRYRIFSTVSTWPTD